MTVYSNCLKEINLSPRVWLVTGAAGFIGSNLVETLLKNGQVVKGLDNFSTGYQKNLDMIKETVTPGQWKNFHCINGDIRDLSVCKEAVHGVSHVLHQAAIGSVVRSIEDPVFTNHNNIDGFLNMLVAARDEKTTFIYAASSSTYGDEPTLPKKENKIGNPLSPYAVTKYVNELYANVFASTYGSKSIGLRYFNIFGRRQDPDGAYAAVIPQWFARLIDEDEVFINGDGETSRDFCYIDNCVQANILASCAKKPEAWNKVYNIAFGERTTLNELFSLILKEVQKYSAHTLHQKPMYRDFRVGDVRHSLADITLAKELLGYNPTYSVAQGIIEAGQWYIHNLK